jgi:GNAT superfamily N-acetyltransferase
VDKFRTSTRIAERTGRGDVCVIAYKYGALAHVRWAAQTPLPLKELSGRVVHLTPHEAYTYDGYTLPMFRRQGIGSEARIFLITHLAQQGIHRAYAMTRTDNRYTSQSEDKRVREGRIRIIGLIVITTLLDQMRCTYSAATAATRFLLARLFQLPLHTVHVRNPANR